MTESELLLPTQAPRETVPVATPEAPHSWDRAGRNLPAAKLDWTECLPFHQVRGVEIAPDTNRLFPGSAPSGGNRD